ncbi:protein kinase domain-containing protein [Nocardia blacklockiae]|uniref:protein kinase domain-containing protein n=1 Tax=Nocardia blacklockiae TaxID=480036 RepID=UPI001893587B|nr:serine/threonine-protein kinase [Nocardia blacklockiae]MBF6174840.1 protein kinase [Nocardia blacklockiae]
MVFNDPLSTQRDLISGFAAELDAAGFTGATEIGSGGFGVVYRCLQPALERTVAVKVLTADLESEHLERFVREQLAMGKLSGHPNIVSVFEVGSTATGRPFIVMQHQPHGSLDARIQDYGPLEWQDAVRIGVKIAGALETAHRLGMLHRDVKPGNILLDEYGEPQLADFGIARLTGGFVTTAGTVTGSPAFTAPEVLQGHTPDATADVYGLASTLFCAATGHAVFERRSGEQLVAQFLRITRQPTPELGDAGLPPDVTAVIERAMSRERDQRPSTAAEFGELLREVQQRHGLAPDDLPIPLPPAEPATPRSSTAATGSGWRAGSQSNTTRTPTPPVAATRLRPPVPARTLVARERLLEVLRQGRDRRLTVIHGPAGFGKTTLAAQWCEVLSAESIAVAWLTVDHDDNTLIWFLSHLIDAIRVVRPGLARELGELLEEHGEESERYVLTSLINDIDRRGEDLVVVIDDWHCVSADAVSGALRFLLENCSPALHLVVASRHRAGLPMVSLRARDELVEIDTAALRFDVEEAWEFLVELGGLALDRGDIEDLVESTEGWVAALQLAALSLRGSDDPGSLIGHLSGRHHAIGEFLVENVLDTLEPGMLEFLVSTAITERTCGELAAALTGAADGQELLEQVEQQDLFLRRLDDGRWFRYHHLFQDFLRQRLEQQGPQRIAELHRAASDWFAAHRHVSEAVDHALLAGDEGRAVEIVERDGMALLEYGQMGSLIGLVGKLPARAVETRPRLQLDLAWANILLHRAESAERALWLVEQQLGGADGDESVNLRAEAAVVRAVVAVRADVLGGVEELLAPCFARAEQLSPYVVAIAANVATLAAGYRCDFDEALRLQEWSLPYMRRNKGYYNNIHGLCFMGLAASLRLDIARAEQYFRRALKAAKQSGGTHSYGARLAGSLLGELLYERGEIAEAERLLDEGYKLGPEAGVVDFKLARYVVGARIKALVGDRAAAIRRLNEGARIARSMALPRLAAEVENERLRLGLPPHPEFGPLPVVEYDHRREPVDAIDEFTVLYEEFTAIRLLLAAADPERTALACRWAQEWVDRLETLDRPRELLKARRLLIACLAAAGRAEEAKSLLAKVCAQCAESGSVRYVLDGGPHVVHTLAALHADQEAGRWDPDWPHVPPDFLAALVEGQAAQRI